MPRGFRGRPLGSFQLYCVFSARSGKLPLKGLGCYNHERTRVIGISCMKYEAEPGYNLILCASLTLFITISAMGR